MEKFYFMLTDRGWVEQSHIYLVEAETEEEALEKIDDGEYEEECSWEDSYIEEFGEAEPISSEYVKFIINKTQCVNLK